MDQIKVLLHGTGNYIQFLIMNHNGKEYEIQYTHIYIHIIIAESLCHIPETNTTLYVNYILQ